MTRLRRFAEQLLFPATGTNTVNGESMNSDTDPKVAAKQREMFRRMTNEERVQMAIEMSNSIREVALDGIRMRQPGISPEEEMRELLRVMYGFTARR